ALVLGGGKAVVLVLAQERRLLRPREQRGVDGVIAQRQGGFTPATLGDEAIVAVLEPFNETDEAALRIGFERARDILAVKRHTRCAARAGDADKCAAAADKLGA